MKTTMKTWFLVTVTFSIFALGAVTLISKTNQNTQDAVMARSVPIGTGGSGGGDQSG